MTVDPSPATAQPGPDPKFAEPRLAACYDAFEVDRPDLDHYQALLAELGARTVLDVGCGTGTLALRLAADGVDVTGIDPAAASLDVARAKPGGDTVTWLHGTAEDLPALGADAAVMTGNVAQVLLTDEAWSATLRGIRGALRPEGHLVLESRRPEARAWEQWTTPDAGTVQDVPGVGAVRLRRTGLEVELPLVTFTEEYRFPDGTTLPSTSTLRFRAEQELRATLEGAGFSVEEIRQAPDRPGLEFVVIARAR